MDIVIRRYKAPFLMIIKPWSLSLKDITCLWKHQIFDYFSLQSGTNDINQTLLFCMISTRSLTRAKALSSTSYTTMESATEVTLNLRFGNASQSFPILFIWTGLPLHHMSCKVCETIREADGIRLFEVNQINSQEKTDKWWESERRRNRETEE